MYLMIFSKDACLREKSTPSFLVRPRLVRPRLALASCFTDQFLLLHTSQVVILPPDAYLNRNLGLLMARLPLFKRWA